MPPNLSYQLRLPVNVSVYHPAQLCQDINDLCYNYLVMGQKPAFNAELFFAALADNTRRRLLNLMRDGEICVCFFAEALGTNNPKISRHLSYLKRAGLVTGRREGKWIHYSVQEPADQSAKVVLDAVMDMFASDGQMRADRKKMEAVCCAPPKPVTISKRS